MDKVNLTCTGCGIGASSKNRPGAKIILHAPFELQQAEQHMIVEQSEHGFLIVGVKVDPDSTPTERAGLLRYLFAGDLNIEALSCKHTFERSEIDSETIETS